MTREEAKELLPIIQAWAEGKSIQYQTDSKTWSDITKDLYPCNHPSLYRIKPESNYRPFNSKEECWQEMHNHSDFGWVISKNCKVIYHIDSVFNTLLIDHIGYSFDDMYQEYEFLDGTPFGIKEE